MAVSHMEVSLMKGFLLFNYKNTHTNSSFAYHAVSTIQFKLIYELVSENILTIVNTAMVDCAVLSAAFLKFRYRDH